MHYLFSDFRFLTYACQKNVRTPGDVENAFAEAYGHSLPYPALLHALTSLSAGGFLHISPENGRITPETPLTVTESGRRTGTVSGIRKLFGRSASIMKEWETAFTEREIPPLPEETANWFIDGEAFRCVPLYGGRLSETVADGIVTLTWRTCPECGDNGQCAYEEGNPGTDESPALSDEEVTLSDTLTVREQSDGADNMLSLLFATTDLLTKVPRTRKAVIHDASLSYVVTLSPAYTAEGDDVRIQVAPIAFNRQRFRRKRDSDLDYAQCRDAVMDFTVSLSEWGQDVRFGVLSLPSLLHEEAQSALRELDRVLP